MIAFSYFWHLDSAYLFPSTLEFQNKKRIKNQMIYTNILQISKQSKKEQFKDKDIQLKSNLEFQLQKKYFIL